MAINPGSAFPGAITPPDANYPYGSSQDEVTPGVSGDGTPYNKLRADDIFGFQQALLQAASIVPSGNADTALVSQYLDALQILFYSTTNPDGFTDDQTGSEILSALLAVDGSGSGLDADKLDAQHGSFYLNASNLNAGTIPLARLGYVSNLTSKGRTKFPNGLIVQWNRETGEGVKTFDLNFNSTPFAIVGNIERATASAVSDLNLNIGNLSVSGFEAFIVGGNYPFWWAALGI